MTPVFNQIAWQYFMTAITVLKLSPGIRIRVLESACSLAVLDRSKVITVRHVAEALLNRPMK